MGSSRPEILGAYLTERLSVYDCPESCGADFSGPCGVAQSARVGAGGLLVHGGLPQNGNLRLCATKATSSRLRFRPQRPKDFSGRGNGQNTPKTGKHTSLLPSQLPIAYPLLRL